MSDTTTAGAPLETEAKELPTADAMGGATCGNLSSLVPASLAPVDMAPTGLIGDDCCSGDDDGDEAAATLLMLLLLCAEWSGSRSSDSVADGTRGPKPAGGP